MATSIIEDPGKIFIRKLYSCQYSIGGWEHKYYAASQFGIYPIQGYTIVGVYTWTSGSSETSVTLVTPGAYVDSQNNPTVMGLFRKPNTSNTTTAYIGLLWVKNEYIT